MRTALLIPARYGSSRFPGKPLELIAGRSLISRMYSIAAAVRGVDFLAVATDDDRIEAHVRSFGGQVVRTPVECRNGSERCHAALQEISRQHPVKSFDFVVNLQGDTPLTPPTVIEAIIAMAAKNPNAGIVTPAVPLSWEEREKYMHRDSAKTGGTFVVLNSKGEALYFSRFPIPFVRHDSPTAKAATDKTAPSPSLKHLGIYGYRTAALAQYITLEPSPLEEAEQLEQLRALENGISIAVCTVDLGNRTLWSMDTRDDHRTIESIIAREGELEVPVFSHKS